MSLGESHVKESCLSLILGMLFDLQALRTSLSAFRFSPPRASCPAERSMCLPVLASSRSTLVPLRITSFPCKWTPSVVPMSCCGFKPMTDSFRLSSLLGDPDRLQATVYMTTKAQQKISLLSQDDFTSLVEAEKRKTGPAAMPPALPPRKDSQAILRQGSIASLRPPTLSHSVSVSSSMSYAQTERETLDVATEDLSSESTLLRSRASNYSSVSLADSTILKEEEDNTMVISQMPLALVERWCNSAGSIKAFSTGGPVNMLVETQALEQITIPPPMAPPRSPVHASGSGSGGAADDVEQKGGILKRFNSLVRKKKPEPSPFARTASVQSAGLVVTTHAVTRRSFFQFVAQPQIEGVWIPGTYAQPPTSLAECELWLGKIATKAIAEDDKVPEWVAAVAKMKQYGLL